MDEPVSLGEVHTELSHLLFAARSEFRGQLEGMPMLTIKILYQEGTNLSLEFGFYGTAVQKRRNADIIRMRLQRGIIHSDYDYRFDGIQVPSQFTDHGEAFISAAVRLYDRHRNGGHRKARGTPFDRPQNAPKPPYEWPVPPPYQPTARNAL
jgi:hypothetical protein